MIQKESPSINHLLATLNALVDRNQPFNIYPGELSYDFYVASERAFTLSEVNDLCELVFKLSNLQGATYKYLEKVLWGAIVNLVFSLPTVTDFKFHQDEELMPGVIYKSDVKTNLSRLLKLALDVLALKIGKSEASVARIGSALQVVSRLSENCYIDGVLKLTKRFLLCKNEKIQMHALEALDYYFTFNEDEIEPDLVIALDSIFEVSDDETAVLICLNIKVSAGLIAAETAFFEMEDWRMIHYGDSFYDEFDTDLEDDDIDELNDDIDEVENRL